MDNLIKKDNKFLEIVHSIENWLLVVVTAAIVVFSGTQILLRNAFDSGITWVPPMLGILVIWVGLLGALIATRNNAHIKINILTTYLADRYKPFAFTLSYLFSATILAILTYYSIEFVKLDFSSDMEAFGSVPVWMAQIILPVTFFLMSIRYAAYTVLNIIEIVKRYA
jgi:TRAP-type C4-dicarboxylate transport system permease small subunit